MNRPQLKYLSLIVLGLVLALVLPRLFRVFSSFWVMLRRIWSGWKRALVLVEAANDAVVRSTM